MDKDLKRVESYCDRVLSNDIPSCSMVVLAVKRFRSDLERADLYFDEKPFVKFCSFARQFKHFKGDKAGEYFELEDWQLFIAANIFGLKKESDGKRKYNYADIYVPRKNGKTMFASILALYFLLMDSEAGAEVYTAAVDQSQARLCYDASAEVLRNSIFGEMVKFYQWGMKYPGRAGVYKPLSKDTKNKDGLNIHAAICDERHAWPNNEIYDVIKTGMGARSQPMLLSISTAGTDTSNPYFEDVETFKQIMLGIKAKDNHFLMLYTPDEGDRWDDPETWRKVNPNLGVSLSWNYMHNECEEAKLRGGTFLVAFCTKNLNMWVDAPTVWIEDDVVKACNAPVDMESLKGQSCYVGIDLASKTDICAVAMFFPKFKIFRYAFFVPEAKVVENADRVDYRKWAEQGWLTVTPGKVLDEDWFVARCFQLFEPYKIKCIAYDPWGMWNITQKFGRYSEYLMEYQQSIRYMSVPTKWFESAVLKGEVNFGDNPIIRWMMRNVVVYVDPNANIKLDKAKSRNKIDGVVASVDAIGGYLAAEKDKKEIYIEHGLRTISLG